MCLFSRLNPIDLSETAKLPLVIREKDVVYQVYHIFTVICPFLFFSFYRS